MATAGPVTGYTVATPGGSQDLGSRYVSKNYLLDLYPNLVPGITSPGLWSCGYNLNGYLGNGTITSYSSPIQVGSQTNWKQVSANVKNTAAVKTDGTLWTWGLNNAGQLGNGNTTSYSSPIQVGALTTWKQVACGYATMLAIQADGTLWAWGSNAKSQLGVSASTSLAYSSPIQVGALTNWKQVSCGASVMLAVKTDGTLWGCGYNTFNGQLGNGTTTTYFSPIQIGALTDWKFVTVDGSAGATAALKVDGSLWTWGNNNQGGLGNNNRTSYSSPVQVGALTNWKQVSVGSYHTTAIKADGTLWAWGMDSYGQLGNGNRTSYSSPIQIGSLTNWKQVAAGKDFTLAVKTDGSLWSCGYNGAGQLGTGNTTSYSSPVQVGALTTWKQVACGYRHTVAIKDGYL